MKERAINISSVNRQNIGKSEANDFVIKFNPILKLEDIMKHELAMHKVMTYSWHNISDQLKKNKTKYSSRMVKIGKQLILYMVRILIQT